MSFTMYILIAVCILAYVLKQLTSGSSKLHYKVHYYISFFKLYFGFTLISTIILPYLLLRPTDVRNFKVFAYLTRYLMYWLNIKLQIRNLKHLSIDKGAVIICNHQSALDCLVLCQVINEVEDEITAVTKKELIYFGPFGLCCYLCGLIFIERNNVERAYKQLQLAKDLMLKRKVKIWYFPEGTRNVDNTKLLPFRKGAFNIAVEAQVPILPVVLSPYHLNNSDKNVFDKGIVAQFLEPVSTTGLTISDVPHLTNHCHNKMTEAYQKLSQEDACVR